MCVCTLRKRPQECTCEGVRFIKRGVGGHFNSSRKELGCLGEHFNRFTLINNTEGRPVDVEGYKEGVQSPGYCNNVCGR